MKFKFFLLIAIAAAMWQSVYGQVSLNLVWQKNVFPIEINESVFSIDGKFIYCAIGNTIQKMDAKMASS